MIALRVGETLLRDYWPAEVTVGADGCRSKVMKLARVYVTDQRTIVAAMSNGRVAAVSYEHDDAPGVLHINGVQGGRTRLVARSGTTLSVAAAHGCGCSSPLAALPVPR